MWKRWVEGVEVLEWCGGCGRRRRRSAVAEGPAREVLSSVGSLGYNKIGGAGAAAIADAMKTSSTSATTVGRVVHYHRRRREGRAARDRGRAPLADFLAPMMSAWAWVGRVCDSLRSFVVRLCHQEKRYG